jgi:hypothetical protein
MQMIIVLRPSLESAESFPCPVAERDLLDEPAGSQIRPACSQVVQHGPDAMLDLFDCRSSLGVGCEQG